MGVANWNPTKNLQEADLRKIVPQKFGGWSTLHRVDNSFVCRQMLWIGGGLSWNLSLQSFVNDRLLVKKLNSDYPSRGY